MAYLVTRWSSPDEWSINTVPDGYGLDDANAPIRVFSTFSEAKAWLIDQTEAWYHGFRDDMRTIRKLRKHEIGPA